MRRFSLKLLRQDRGYECVLSSVAMCIAHWGGDEDPSDIANHLREHLAHNPEQILWPNAPGVKKYRGIQMEDLLPLIYEMGFFAMPFFRVAMVNSQILSYQGEVPMAENPGVLMFLESNHVVAWDGHRIYDPRGYVANEFDSSWTEFWLIKGRGPDVS